MIKYANTNISNSAKIKALKVAKEKLETLTLFEETKIHIEDCEKILSELYFRRNKTRKKRRKIIVLSSGCLAVVIGLTLLSTMVVIPAINYDRAGKAYINGDYSKATELYENLADYKDSDTKVTEARYALATQQLEDGEFGSAYSNFKLIKDYKDSNDKLAIYAESFAEELMGNGKYQEAAESLSVAKNSEEVQKLKNKCYLTLAKEKYKNKEYNEVIRWYEKITNYDESADFYVDSCYQVGLLKLQKMSYKDAIRRLEIAGDYKDAKEKLNEAKYAYIQQEIKEIKTREAQLQNDKKTTSGTRLQNDEKTTDRALRAIRRAAIRESKENIYAYLKDLTSIKYKDAEDIYEDLYDWKAELSCLNEKPDDYETKKDVINNESSYLHFQFDLSGGIPGETGTFFFKLIHPNGYVKNATWAWDDKKGGSSLGCEWTEGFSARGRGTMTIEIYHKESNKLIGSATVKVQ